MHDVIRNPPPTTWSSCSVETLQNSLAGELGHCLHNRPEASVTDYTCGNGLLDEGEVCDCGSAKVSIVIIGRLESGPTYLKINIFQMKNVCITKHYCVMDTVS